MNFDSKRFERIAPDFEKWWEHELDRPIIQVSLMDRKAGGDYFASNYRRDILIASYDFDLPVADAAKAIETAYDSVVFLGDAFPVFYMRPTGVMGGMLGQKFTVNREQGTVWFHPTGGDLEDVANMKLQRDGALWKRAIALTKQVQEHFQGSIAVGVPDLGGVYDILSSICDPSGVLEDLCMEEDAVLAAAWNIHRQMKEALRDFQAVIDPKKVPGYTCWATMLSQKPYYVLQNDFSAMIGPGMFDDFYLPILEEESKSVERTIYHLDGPAAVRHLDSIVSVKGIDGVQWVNGAGAPGLDQWPELYRKVVGAGKLCQVFINSGDELRYIDDIAGIVGSLEGFCFICTGDTGERELFERYLDKYHVPH